MSAHNRFERTCARCNEKFISGGAAKYCLECLDDVVRERHAAQRRRRKATLKGTYGN